MRHWLRKLCRWVLEVTEPTPSFTLLGHCPTYTWDTSKEHNVLATIEPSAEVDRAVRMAFASKGLPTDRYSDDFDVARTGKLHEVLDHASQLLETDHPLRTVGDIKALLENRH